MSDLNSKYQIVAKVKRACDWERFDHARLHISVGQSYHEGVALRATLQWASDNFETIEICVNDTLQRHNLEFSGLSKQAAFVQSEQDGREWIERNYAAIKSYPNIKITRWDEWRNQETYSTLLGQMRDLYNESQNFKAAVDEEVVAFWARRNNGSNQGEFQDFKNHSTEYLLEECAAFSIMFSEKQAADIYPGSTLLPCSLLKGMGKYGFTRIEFKSPKLMAV